MVNGPVPATFAVKVPLLYAGNDWFGVIQTTVGGAQVEQPATALVISTRKPV
jgi:hypothetical protein